MKPIEMRIESDAFESAREDFNIILHKTIDNMLQKSSNEATITLKVGILLESFGDVVTVPEIKHKCVAAMKLQIANDGSFNGEYSLKMDDTTGEFVLVPMLDQITMFEQEVDDDC